MGKGSSSDICWRRQHSFHLFRICNLTRCNFHEWVDTEIRNREGLCPGSQLLGSPSEITAVRTCNEVKPEALLRGHCCSNRLGNSSPASTPELSGHLIHMGKASGLTADPHSISQMTNNFSVAAAICLH